MPFNLGAPELIIVLVIIMLIFGVGKLPEVGGAIGKGIREFRKASSEDVSAGERAESKPARAEVKEVRAEAKEIPAETRHQSEV